MVVDYSWYLDGSYLAGGSWQVNDDPTWFGWRNTAVPQNPLPLGTYKLLLQVEGTSISYSEAFTLGC